VYAWVERCEDSAGGREGGRRRGREEAREGGREEEEDLFKTNVIQS